MVRTLKKCQALPEWVATSCNEIRDMQIARHVKYVGTMIGPEVHLHRWDALLGKFIQRCRKLNETSKSLVERLVDFIFYALYALVYIGSISAPKEATLKEEAHALQCTTAGPYNAIPTDLLRRFVDLGATYVV